MRVSQVIAWMVLTSTLAWAQVAQPPARKTTAAAPRITDSLLSEIREAAAKGGTYWGFLQSEGDSLRIHVLSNRAVIASKIIDAAASGGRFTPPAELRDDVILVKCGDHDIGEIFQCARVALKDTNGRAVKPISYSAETNSYSNALGARWSVREVFATYPVAGLAAGFAVDFAGTDGTEWTFLVNKFEAADGLLLRLGDASPQ